MRLRMRVVDALLLVTGLTLLVSATLLSMQPEINETPAIIAMSSQHLTEGRSAGR